MGRPARIDPTVNILPILAAADLRELREVLASRPEFFGPETRKRLQAWAIWTQRQLERPHLLFVPEDGGRTWVVGAVDNPQRITIDPRAIGWKAAHAALSAPHGFVATARNGGSATGSLRKAVHGVVASRLDGISPALAREVRQIHVYSSGHALYEPSGLCHVATAKP